MDNTLEDKYLVEYRDTKRVVKKDISYGEMKKLVSIVPRSKVYAKDLERQKAEGAGPWFEVKNG